MGLRYASLRHPNVVVMAPALTETAQTQSFQFASSLSLALKENPKRREASILSDVISHAGMNGHSPSKTYSINGIVKNLKTQEFLPLHDRSDGEIEGGIEKIPQNMLNHAGGLMMSNNFQEPGAMGLQKSNKSDGEKPAEMDQMFKNLVVANEDLNTNELGQNVEEILEAISSMENNVQTGGETMFEFEKELFDVDVMNMCVDETLVAVNKDTLIKERIEEARTKQFMVARKCEFLARRLKKLEARALGKHVADEITGLIEYSTFLLELQSRGRVEGSRPLPLSSMSLFMRQMDHAATQQASALARTTNKQFKYFGSGSSSNSLVSTSNGVRTPIVGSVLPAYPQDVVQEMDSVAGELHTQLYKAHKDIDSDITESSSGGESADELIPYTNQYQHPLSISKRCKWRWLEDRAAVASRCTWLQSQIADLDYRIRQHNEIRRQLRANKNLVKLEQPTPPQPVPNGWPSDKAATEERSTTDSIGSIGGCARTRPICKLTKRKIIQMSGLHRLNKKAGRPTSLRCSCRGDTPGMGPCGLCTGRQEPTLPRDPLELAPLNERVALVDPGFHPVLSFNSDVSLSVHYDAVMKCADWQVKASRISSKSQLSGTVATNEEGEDGMAASAAASSGIISGSGVSGIVRNIPNQVGRPRKQISSSSASIYHSGLNSTDNSTNDGGLLPDHHLDLQRSKAAAHAVSVKLRRKIAGGKKRRKNNIPFERFRHRRKNSGGYSVIEGDYVVDSGEVSTNTDGARYPSSPVPSPASVHGKDKESMKRKRENSYDIDNIVIPYSMASATRLEKLHYKEILTPKWRFVKEMDHKNGIVRRSSQELVEGEEDMNEETFIERHNQAEEEERKKFLSYMKVPNSVLNSFLGSSGGSGRGRGHRRADSRAESFGPNTPDPMSPGGGESSMTSPPATPQTTTSVENQSELPGSAQQVTGRRRTISMSKMAAELQSFPSASDYMPEVLSYEPRTFPLSEEVFNKMLAENSDNNHQGYPPLEANFFQLENFESPPSVSTDSADSLTGEDPNDPEWTGFGGKNNVKR